MTINVGGQVTFTGTGTTDPTYQWTAITGNPNNPSNSDSATFTFTSSGSYSTFQCHLDNESISPCTSPKTYSGLTDGLHIFEVRAVDPSDNTDFTPATYTWTIDTMYPDPPAVFGVTPTSDITPIWHWTSGGGNGNGTFRYQLNSEADSWSADTTATSYTPTSALSTGSHTLYVQERDEAGNWSLSGSFAITIYADSDGDGLPDPWEIFHFGDLSRNGTRDLDGDGVSDYQEYLDGTDPASCLWSEVDSTHRRACVNHTSLLKNCLTEAQADGRHNTIKVVQGTYVGLFAYSGNENYDLNLEGGYEPDCATFSYNPERTVLDGDLDSNGTGDGVVLDLITLNAAGIGNILVEGFHVKNGHNGVDDGGDIRVFTANGHSTIIGNVVSGSSAVDGGGIGVETFGGDIFLMNNIVYGNSANQGGGIGAASVTGNITILNNTITGNEGLGPESVGGLAVGLGDTAHADIQNNIIWDNTGAIPDVAIDTDYEANTIHGTFWFDYNDAVLVNIWTNHPSPAPFYGVQNINGIAPLFVDASNKNYHLAGNSPVIDKGNNTHTLLPTVDIDGNNRKIGSAVDIGADEVMLPPGTPVVIATTPTTDATPTWTWTSDGGGTGTFRYRLDNPDLSTGATTTTLKALRHPRHSRTGTIPFMCRRRPLPDSGLRLDRRRY